MSDGAEEHPIIARLNRVAGGIADICLIMACLVLLWLVALTCVDVIGRYFFRSPVVGATELVQISMAGTIFFSLPAMFLRDDQVVVDLFSFVRRGWLGWVICLIFSLVTVVAVYIVADRVFDYAVRAHEDGDKTEYLGIPRVITVSFITLSLYAAAVMGFIRLWIILFNPCQSNPAEGEDI